jgi:hypothetical protein
MRAAGILLCILLIFACQSDKSLEFTQKTIDSQACEDCPHVQINIPEASQRTLLGRNINTAIREEIIELLDYDEEGNATGIEEAIEDFTAGWRTLAENFPEELAPWEATVLAQTSYENSQLLSLRFEAYLFTGGAHGYTTTRFLNFNKETGEEVDALDFFSNRSKLEEVAESAFRKTFEISADSAINSTGFMFEENTYYLPEQIGFSPEGLTLLYNPYEVASYADGPLTVVIPFGMLKETGVAPKLW